MTNCRHRDGQVIVHGAEKSRIHATNLLNVVTLGGAMRWRRSFSGRFAAAATAQAWQRSQQNVYRMRPVQGTCVSKQTTIGDGREEERVSAIPCSQLSSIKQCLTIWYDATSYIYTCSKADISQLNLLHGTENLYRIIRKRN